MYDIDTGKPYLRAGERQRRLAHQKPPCFASVELCPKGNPTLARERELSPRNLRTLALYVRNRALSGQALTDAERADPLLLRNFAIIDQIMRRWEQGQAAEPILNALNRWKRHG